MKTTIIATTFATSVNATDLIQFKAGQAAVASEVNANFNSVNAKAELAQAKSNANTTELTALSSTTTSIAERVESLVKLTALQGDKITLNDDNIQSLTAALNQQTAALNQLIEQTKPFILNDADGQRIGEVITLGTHGSFDTRYLTIPHNSINTAIIHLDDLGLIVDVNMHNGSMGQFSTVVYENDNCTG